ncbi:MAG: cupin domain-containing protein [Burkholderiales bacterium]
MKKLLAVLAAAFLFNPAPAASQPALAIKPLAQKKVAELPAGQLYWRIENFDGLDQAKAAASQWSLAAESAGKAWLFTLGAPGGSTPGGSKVTEFGPVPRISAPEYLLRINEATGTPGAITKIHSHPGSESFFVVRGEQSIRGPRGVTVMKPGDPTIGQGEQPMQVWSSGSTGLHSLVMFVVDATRPFSTPAKFD